MPPQPTPDWQSRLDADYQAGRIDAQKYMRASTALKAKAQPTAAPAEKPAESSKFSWLTNFLKDDLSSSIVNVAVPGAMFMPETFKKPMAKELRALVGGGDLKQAQMEGFKQGALEDGVNAVLMGGGALAGKVGAPLVRGAAAAFDGEATSKLLTKYFDNVIAKKAANVAAKGAPEELYGKAYAAGRDANIPIDQLTKFAHESLANGEKLSEPMADMLNDIAKFHARGDNAGKLAIHEIDQQMRNFGAIIKDKASTSAEKNFARRAWKALLEDFQAAPDAPGAPELSRAKEVVKGQKDVGALKKLMINTREDLGENISSRRMAKANSQERLKSVETLLEDDPELLNAWRVGLRGVKESRKKVGSWFPQFTRIPAVDDAYKRMITHTNVKRIFSNSDVAREFIKVMTPGIFTTPEALSVSLGKIAEHLGEPLYDEGEK